jgi:UDP-glucose 6-dehydrogenase
VVDRDEQKVHEVSSGRPPVSEPGLEVLIAGGVRGGRISTIHFASDAVNPTDLRMVYVGISSGWNGS